LARVIREGRWLWMLQHPVNLAYEAASHQFAQVYDLAGPVKHAQSTVSGRRELGGNQHFFDTWQVSLICERATAQVFTSYGTYGTFQLVAICQGGVMIAELNQNRFTAVDHSRWLGTRWGRFAEPLHLARGAAAQELRNGLGNLAGQARSALPPTTRADPYFISTRDSVAAFHHGISSRQPDVDGGFGKQVVAMCDAATEDLAAQVEEVVNP
jgi:hypothetical protein